MNRNRAELHTPDAALSPEEQTLQDAVFSAALLSVGGVADRAMVCRTQRLVREQALQMEERRRRARYGIGLTILAFSLLLLVLTPVLWSAFHLQLDEGWQGFTAVDMQSMYVLGWLFPVTMVGLILAFLRMRAGRDGRRIHHRVGTRLDSLVR